MRKLYFSLLLFFCAFIQLEAQNVNVTATAGTTSGSYLTLKAAFDAINAGTHQGAINIAIVASTVETATAQLDATGGIASYTSVNITASGLISISASIASSLITFNGATNVTIDGTNQLTLANGLTTGNVLTYTNSASKVVVKNCTIQGSTASLTSGVILLDSLGTGNGVDNNTFDNITVDGQSLAARLLYSFGRRNSLPNGENGGDTIRNSSFRNVGTTIASTAFLWLDLGNTGWTIQNNSLYQSSVTPITAQGVIRGIITVPNYTSDAHSIIGNFIGGNAPAATGTMQLTGSGAIAVGFIGMDIETGGSGSIVQSNIVRNVSVNYSFSGGSFSNAGIFCFIGGYSGTITLNKNKVENLTFSNSAGSALAYGIYCNGRVTQTGAVFPTFNITNDTVSTMTGIAGGTGNIQFFGMRLETSSGNLLTNTSASNPFFLVKNSVITGLSTTYNGTATILRGISNSNTQGTSSTAQLVPIITIDSNKINNFSCAGNSASYTSPAVIGIYFSGSNVANPFDLQIISANTINALSATSTSDVSNTAMGMLVANGFYEIYRNKIYDIRNKANAVTSNPSIVGINVNSGLADTSYIYNNFISLGSGETSNVQVLGVLNNVSSTQPLFNYFNSIYITGAGAGGNTKSSAALLRGTETFATGITTPLDVVNNILYNVRTGGTGKHYAIANTNATPATGFTSDSNDLYSLNPATIANWGGADNDIATYKVNASDGGSKSFTVNFVDPNNGDLHLTGASIGDFRLEGTPIPGINTDFDEQTRNNDPYIGADEILTSPLPVQMDFFTGRRQATANFLSWKASCSSSSITFEVERSTDGRRFSAIGKITASQARCASPFDYTDVSPAAGMNYYRLKITETDGNLKYSAIIAILNKATGFELVGLYPTLIESTATLSITSAGKTSLQMNISDLQGRIMLQKQIGVNEGSALININLATLAKGVYHLTGTTPEGYEKTIRFVKH